MRILIAITALFFCAVLWMALALARRIRRSQFIPPRSVGRTPSRRIDKQEFFEAGEFRTPRPLRLEQEIFQQKPRRHLAEITFAPETSARAVVNPIPDTQEATEPAPRSPQPIPIRPAPAFASLFGQNVPIARITESPQVVQHLETTAPEILSPGNHRATSYTAPVSLPLPFALHRRPPQTARPSGLRRRVDLSHYNKDMGDLTDPYTNPLRGSGTQGPMPADPNNR